MRCLDKVNEVYNQPLNTLYIYKPSLHKTILFVLQQGWNTSTDLPVQVILSFFKSSKEGYRAVKASELIFSDGAEAAVFHGTKIIIYATLYKFVHSTISSHPQNFATNK